LALRVEGDGELRTGVPATAGIRVGVGAPFFNELGACINTSAVGRTDNLKFRSHLSPKLRGQKEGDGGSIPGVKLSNF
jgi:hypothetical protein